MRPSEPPVPPPTTLSVVPFPKLREQAQLQETCFSFLDPSALREEEEKKELEEGIPKKDHVSVIEFSVSRIHLKTADMRQIKTVNDIKVPVTC